uniref:BTB/POZ domain-containing protein KCTD8-like n=1 Tax=Phallusia mammillata TaxID=59560 RepID=A0A6F9DFM9_9ASCI|nr:BTB/POZ domain-containing protein KCTD8-like [Phallusia mammillata]
MHEGFITKMASEENQIVELNVGGTIYSTSAKTLTCVLPKSKMAAGVRAFISGVSATSDGIPFICDANKRMFIDRDGVTFRLILEYLRKGAGGIAISDWLQKICPDVIERHRLRSEAEFFGLDELASILKKIEARKNFVTGNSDQAQIRSTGSQGQPPFYPRIYQGPSPISRNETDSPSRSLDRVMSTGSLSQNRPFYITIGYRSSYSATRDSTSLEKFRRITRITVSGRSDIAKEVFRDDLNDSRDPDRYPSDGYTSRYYLKHNYLEHAFETLASRGFILSTSCSSGSKTLPAQAKEYKQWTTYVEYVFYRAPWDE